jgi:hypothetical protein
MLYHLPNFCWKYVPQAFGPQCFTDHNNSMLIKKIPSVKSSWFMKKSVILLVIFCSEVCGIMFCAAWTSPSGWLHLTARTCHIINWRIIVLMNRNICCNFTGFWHWFVGRVAQVSIGTDYGLDGPGIKSQWGRDFPHLSSTALGPT